MCGHAVHWQQLSVVGVLVDVFCEDAPRRYVAHPRGMNGVSLVDDAASAGGPVGVGLACPAAQRPTRAGVVYGSGGGVEVLGNRLQLRLPVQIKAGFAGYRAAYAAVRDRAGNNSGWQIVCRRWAP